MSKKVSDLSKIREEKRKSTGCTLEEIKKKAAEDFKKYKEVSRDNKEPENFHSGDTKNLFKRR